MFLLPPQHSSHPSSSRSGRTDSSTISTSIAATTDGAPHITYMFTTFNMLLLAVCWPGFGGGSVLSSSCSSSPSSSCYLSCTSLCLSSRFMSLSWSTCRSFSLLSLFKHLVFLVFLKTFFYIINYLFLLAPSLRFHFFYSYQSFPTVPFRPTPVRCSILPFLKVQAEHVTPSVLFLL